MHGQVGPTNINKYSVAEPTRLVHLWCICMKCTCTYYAVQDTLQYPFINTLCLMQGERGGQRSGLWDSIHGSSGHLD